MAPLNGAAGSGFWANDQRVKEFMLMTVVLALVQKHAHKLPINLVADIIGEGKLSQASTRSKLTQLIGQGQQRVRDHRERAQAAREVSDSGSATSLSVSEGHRLESPTRLHRYHAKKGKKRAPDSEADQEDGVGSPFHADPESGTALIGRPKKRSSRGLQEHVSYRRANAREETSYKSSKRVRVRKLKPENTIKENETATPWGAHCGFRGAWPLDDRGPLFEPGDFEETAIYVSDDETDLLRLAQSGDWYGFDMKESLVDRRSLVGRADVEDDEDDEQPGEVGDQLLRQLEMASMQTDIALPRESTLCENVDKAAAKRNAPRREKTPDQVKSRKRETARAISAFGQQDIEPSVEARGRAERRSGGKGSVFTHRRSDDRSGGSFSVHNPHARTYSSIVRSKTRPWQGSTTREISVDRSPRIRPSHGQCKPAEDHTYCA